VPLRRSARLDLKSVAVWLEVLVDAVFGRRTANSKEPATSANATVITIARVDRFDCSPGGGLAVGAPSWFEGRERSGLLSAVERCMRTKLPTKSVSTRVRFAGPAATTYYPPRGRFRRGIITTRSAPPLRSQLACTLARGFWDCQSRTPSSASGCLPGGKIRYPMATSPWMPRSASDERCGIVT